MNHPDVESNSGDDSAVDTAEEEMMGRLPVSNLPKYARRAAGSGTLAGIGGAATLLSGVRALRRGKRARGLSRIFLGGVLLRIAAMQRQSGGESDEAESEATTVEIEDTGSSSLSVGETEEEMETDMESELGDADLDEPDVEAPDTAGTHVDEDEDEAEMGEAYVGEEAVDEEEVSAAKTDIEEEGEAETTDLDEDGGEETTDLDEDGGEETTDGGEEAVGTEQAYGEARPEYERLGEAAFDEHSDEVPAPQQVFDRKFLELGTEAFWGVRESDDAVVVTQRYDPLEDGDGVRYIGSSDVDDDRMLAIPDVVQNHWDEVGGGGTAVSSGDDIVFATTDDLEEDGQLLVVPEQWAEDVLGSET